MDSASRSTYSYEPLADAHIRLLYLDPGNGNDLLAGSLKEVHLDQSPAYESLSYEWGNPERARELSVADGSIVPITESLFQALRDLCHERKSQGCRVLWVDAVCINQDDLDERQRQVSLMGSIYRKASRVVTYIGPESDQSALAIGLAQRLTDFRQSRSRSVSSPNLQSASALANAGFPPITDPKWKALKALCLRSWASRCWCAQEFLCNRNLIMMCGRVVLPDWSLIPGVVQLVYARYLPASLLPSQQEDTDSLRDCLMALLHLRSSIMVHPRPAGLLGLLRSFHPFRATDPRDKIYSILGHSRRRDTLGISIDYTVSVEKLYTAVAARILKESPVLNFLLSNLHHKSLERLPSWVPDWSTWYFGSDLAGTGFDATHQASGRTSPELHVNEADGQLDVAGCLIDKIAWMSDRILPYYTTHDGPVVAERDAWIRKQLDFIATLGPYFDGSETTEVLWRTLISNTTRDEMYPDATYRDYFDANLNVSASQSPHEASMARDFCDAVRWRSRYRSLCATEKGYFGAVPQNAEIGDWVCMFHGGRHLFVVRPNASNFSYIGHSYIHGLMSGQVLEADWYAKRTITLV